MGEVLHPTGASQWRTRANALTALRLLAAPACALAIATAAPLAALFFFVLAILTDLADGPVARRYGEVSPLGGLFDHATDATFVVVGLVALSLGGEVPLLLPALIALAFLQYAVDSRAGRERELRASALGRWNGIAYFVLLGIPVVRDGLGLGWPPGFVVRGCGYLLLVSTLASMLDRLFAARKSRPGSADASVAERLAAA